MAETRVANSLAERQWDDEFFTEYFRDNQFNRYMSSAVTAPIVTKDDLTRKKGDLIYFPAVRKLPKRSGVTDYTLLEGNEVELDTKGMGVRVGLVRNGVLLVEWDAQKSSLDMRAAARATLKGWSMDRVREDVIFAGDSIRISETEVRGMSGSSPDGKTPQATAAQMNAWIVNNADRVLFGSSKANAASGVYSTALGTVNNTTGKLTPAAISLAKRMAKTADPTITPIRVAGGSEWYVYFADSMSFRDLKNDPLMMQANRDARPREAGYRDNPLFSDGDLLWDGVIIHEVPEKPTFSNGTIQVSHNTLMGAAAIGAAWAQRLRSITDDRDYGERHGVGIREARGIEKLAFEKGSEGSGVWVQNGMVSHWVAATPDV